jgi:polar amino acid transport system substrate-binding protein
LGLAAFTIIGVAVAVESKSTPLWVWGPLLAVLTGAGGGIIRDVVRGDAKNPSLKGSFYPEIALIWGAILSLFLDWQTHRLDLDEVFLATIITLVGAFLTRILVIFLDVRSPLFGRR